MFCRKCGENIPEDSKFCLKCGTEISQNNDKIAEQENNQQHLDKVGKKRKKHSRISTYIKEIIGFVVEIIGLIVLTWAICKYNINVYLVAGMWTMSMASLIVPRVTKNKTILNAIYFIGGIILVLSIVWIYSGYQDEKFVKIVQEQEYMDVSFKKLFERFSDDVKWECTERERFSVVDVNDSDKSGAYDAIVVVSGSCYIQGKLERYSLTFYVAEDPEDVAAIKLKCGDEKYSNSTEIEQFIDSVYIYSAKDKIEEESSKEEYPDVTGFYDTVYENVEMLIYTDSEGKYYLTYITPEVSIEDIACTRMYMSEQDELVVWFDPSGYLDSYVELTFYGDDFDGGMYNSLIEGVEDTDGEFSSFWKTEYENLYKGYYYGDHTGGYVDIDKINDEWYLEIGFDNVGAFSAEELNAVYSDGCLYFEYAGEFDFYFAGKIELLSYNELDLTLTEVSGFIMVEGEGIYAIRQ